MCSSEHIEVGTGELWMFSKPKRDYFREAHENEYPLNKYFLGSAQGYMEDPLEDMPLHINDKNYSVRAFAKFRFEVGR